MIRKLQQNMERLVIVIQAHLLAPTTQRKWLFLRTNGGHPFLNVLCWPVAKSTGTFEIRERNTKIAKIIRCPPVCEKPRHFWLMNIFMTSKTKTAIRGIFTIALNSSIVLEFTMTRTTWSLLENNKLHNLVTAPAQLQTWDMSGLCFWLEHSTSCQHSIWAMPHWFIRIIPAYPQSQTSHLHPLLMRLQKLMAASHLNSHLTRLYPWTRLDRAVSCTRERHR